METELQNVLEALKNGEFKVTYEAPNNVELCKKEDGTLFYKLYDDVKFGVDFGSCKVTVLGHDYVCDLGCGMWDGDELLDSDELIPVLKAAEGVVSGELCDGDEQIHVYCLANGGDEDLEYYLADDDDCPEDVGFDDDEVDIDVDVEVPISYAIVLDHGIQSESQETVYSISYKDFKTICDYLISEGWDLLDEDSEYEESDDEDSEWEEEPAIVRDEKLKFLLPDLYEELSEFVADEAADNGYEGPFLRFSLRIDKELVKEIL